MQATAKTQRPRSASHALKRACVSGMLAAVLATGLALPEPAFAGSSATVNVRATVLPRFRLDVVSQAPQLELSAGDLERGYVDLPQASTFRFFSNTRLPFHVSVEFDPSIISRVTVRLLEDEITADVPGASGQVRNPHVGHRNMPVTYRVYLNRAAKPGTYAWPIALGFTHET